MSHDSSSDIPLELSPADLKALRDNEAKATDTIVFQTSNITDFQPNQDGMIWGSVNDDVLRSVSGNLLCHPIRQFMLKAKQEIPEQPSIPSAKILSLRQSLITEEADETSQALDDLVDLSLSDETGTLAEALAELGNDVVLDTFVEIVDGCADLFVVTIGTLYAMGLDPVPILRIVNEANLTKFGPGHSFRADGKLIKPEGWEPPNKLIREEVLRQIAAHQAAKELVDKIKTEESLTQKT